MKRFMLWFVLVAVVLAGCGGATEPTAIATVDGGVPTAAPATATVAVETPTAAPSPTVEPSPTAAATETAEAVPTEAPAATATAPAATATAGAEPGAPVVIEEDEAILILEPGNASRVTSPVRVAGEADSTFEQSLAVRIVTIDGETLATEPATIAAELGERGPFETEIAFSVAEETQAWIQVFATSARDGGITHLSSVGLTLAPGGEADIVAVTPHPERIVIDSPQMGETLSGGVVEVRGRGLASFEQTLIVELLDEEGRLIASQPLTVDAPDLGQPGTFAATLAYDISGSMPARVRVSDPSPAFGGEVHVASVEVTLEE